VKYYKHHLGDYATRTAHLSVLEHGAYRLLMDAYYTAEKPLTLDMARLCLMVRATGAAERKAVESVLGEFFNKTETGWQHNRIDSEIQEYAQTVEKNKANGNRGGRPKKTQSVISGIPSGEPKHNLNHKPLTTNHKSTSTRFAEFWSAYPKKGQKPQCLAKWESKNLDPIAEQIISHVEGMADSEQWTKDSGQFCPNPLTYLNQERWEQEAPITKLAVI